MSSARKSPRPKTPRVETPLSPTRITRLEEREELQDLNKRLEFYIMKNREKDASQGVLQREIDELRERLTVEKQELEDQFQDQLEELRKQRDEDRQNNARLTADNNKKVNDLDLARRELAHLKEENRNLRAHNDDLQKQLNAKSLEASQLDDENNKLETQNKILEEKAAVLQVELDNARENEGAAEERAETANARAASAEQNAENATNKAQNEIKKLRNQIDELSHRNNHIEEELRKELTAQLAKIIERRQQEWEDEKNEGLAELKAIYDEKIAAYRDHLERAGHELEMLKSQKAAASVEFEKAKAVQEEFETVKTTLKKRIDELEEAVRAEKARPARQLAEKIEIIRRLKAAFKRKDEEFDQLMDVKIALDMEIKAYRQMLEKEENRLAYKSPVASKKRKMTLEAEEEARGSSAAVPSSSSAGDTSESTLHFSADVEGRFFVIKNSSTHELSVSGWSIHTQVSQQEFKLPDDIVLKPRQTLKVWAGSSGEDDDPSPATYNVVWEGNMDVLFDRAGDVAELVDADGVALPVQVQIVPPEDDQNGSGDEEESEQSDKPSMFHRFVTFLSGGN